MKRIVSILLLIWVTALQAHTFISVGGFDVKKKGNRYCFYLSPCKGKPVTITEALRQTSPQVDAVTLWITRNWEKDWYEADRVQRDIIDKGYVPLFIFYYFGDDISPSFVKSHRKDYFRHLKRFLHYLKRIDGQKIVVLNPEYNMAGTGKWPEMNKIFLKSYKILRRDPQLVVGPCVGDFGDYTKVNEPQEWRLFDPSLKEAAKTADFIAFQEMRALTRNRPEDIRKTAARAYHLSRYLYRTYRKPTLLAYVAISSYGQNGEKIQADAFKSFVRYLPKMVEEGHLMLLGLFHYFDYPGHKGYFKKAEEHFGVLHSDGTPKPSFTYFNQLKSPIRSKNQ